MGSGITKGINNDILLSAAADGTAPQLARLVGAGANVNCRNFVNDWTPLHFACRAGNAETAEWLLQHGADRTQTNSDGKTAEEVAQLNGKENVLGLFFSDLNDLEARNMPTPDLKKASSERRPPPNLNEWDSEIGLEGALAAAAAAQAAAAAEAASK